MDIQKTEDEKKPQSKKVILALAVIGCSVSAAVAFVVGLNFGQDIGYEIGSDFSRWQFYYVVPFKQKFGSDNLLSEIDSLRYVLPYEEGVFDCSEMSAGLERCLENRGWHTFICVGDCPFGSGKHAWLLVETEPDEYIPIEPTNLQLVPTTESYYSNYFIYDCKFERIWQACEYSPKEFDWWNVPY